jgi:hypothetical protein
VEESKFGFSGAAAGQVYRYDSSENVVLCVSCASSFDPEPKQSSFLGGIQGLPSVSGGLPDYTSVSRNGDFAFFTTTAALVPQDVDGEIPAERLNEDHGGAGLEFVNDGGYASPSTDVYEWRGVGVDGCVGFGGCLALITDGRGGFLNLLLGSADEGSDVFVYTRSKLLSQDNDTSGDVYDVRVDGGFAGPAPPPVECEGDACSTPPSAPNDVTPSSLGFTGNGNVPPTPKVKPKKQKAKKMVRKRARKKAGKIKGRVKGKGVRKRDSGGVVVRGGGVRR